LQFRKDAKTEEGPLKLQISFEKQKGGPTAKTRFLINLPLNLALEKGAKQSPLDLFAGTPKG
jgi:hypothetical protein